MKGIYQANTILILNLGVEMIFIIDQRLRAQNIEQDKVKMVINDLVLGLFTEKSFQNNLSKPTKLITHDVCYQLVHQLAHSSIMKLGDDSMSKLYELICMTMKYHLIHSSSHFELYLISQKHMQDLETLDLNQQSIQALNQYRQFFENLYTSMNSFDYMMLRQELLRFFQQKYIRVQLFLNEKWQNQDGSFKVNLKRQAGFYVQKPGQVIVNQEGFPSKTFFVNVEQTGYFIGNPNNSPFNSTTSLGINLYSKQFQKQEQQRQIKDTQQNGDSSKQDLNSFAQMIRIQRDDQIDLFSNKKADKVDSEIVKIEVTDSKSQSMKNSILKDFNIETQDDDDLLDLMDKL